MGLYGNLASSCNGGMLPPKGHEVPTALFQAVVQQNVRELQALIGRRAEKYGPARGPKSNV